MNTPTLLCTPICRCLCICLFLLISSAWYVVITLRVIPFNKRLANELSEGAQQVDVLNPLNPQDRALVTSLNYRTNENVMTDTGFFTLGSVQNKIFLPSH